MRVVAEKSVAFIDAQDGTDAPFIDKQEHRIENPRDLRGPLPHGFILDHAAREDMHFSNKTPDEERKTFTWAFRRACRRTDGRVSLPHRKADCAENQCG